MEPRAKKPKFVVSGRLVTATSGMVTAVFNTVALLLIARNMGPEILGTLGFLLSFVGLFFFLGDLGNSLAFGRVLDKGYPFSKCYRAYTMARLRSVAMMAVVSGIMMAVYIYLLAPEGHTALHPASLAVMLGYFVVLNLAGIWVTALAVKQRRSLYELTESVVKMIAVMALLWVIVPTGDQTVIFQLAFIYLIAGTIGMMLVRNSARRLKSGGDDEEIEVEFMETAARFAPYVAMAALLVNLDKVILWLFSDFGTLGVYVGAQRITIFIAASGVTVEALLADAIRKYVKDNDTEAISNTLRVTERYASLVILPVASFYVFFAEPLLATLLGQQFSGGAVPVAVLAGAGVFTGLAAPHISYMVRANLTKELAIISGIMMVALLCASLLLVPDIILPQHDIHGMNGAALSVLAAAVSGYAATRILSWKRLGCAPHKRMLVHPLCAGIMMAVLHFVVWYSAIDIGLGWLLLLAILGFIVYVVCLYLTGEMLRRDYIEFRELTKPE